MPSHKTITDAAATRFKAPETGQIDHFDHTYPGLSLRVSCGGRKSWTYTFRIGGKQRRMTLGLFPAELDVAGAHNAWRKARDMVKAGRDPARDRMGATDFRSVFEEWMQRDQADNRSAGIVRRRLEKDVLPYWQARPITTISRRDVLDVIDAIADRDKVILARRVHAHLHRMFAWAVGRGIVELNPLTNLPKPGSETKRDRVLTDAELIKVWGAADQLGAPCGNIVKLLILTGARREEIGHLKWAEINGDAIALSGLRTKNGEPHIIPLSTTARAVVASTPRILGEFVFTNDGKSAVGNWGLVKKKLDAIAGIPHWTIYDLRRTAATGLQKLGTPLQVTESILGHTAGSRAGVVGIYQRHDYADEKRAALEAWGEHVIALVERSS